MSRDFGFVQKQVDARILVRVHDADPRLQSLITMLVTGPNAFLKRIKDSPEFKQLFENNVKTEPTPLATGHSLSFATHRFDSTVYRLTRLFFSLDAVLATAAQVQALRHGSAEASDASDFFSFSARQLVQRTRC